MQHALSIQRNCVDTIIIHTISKCSFDALCSNVKIPPKHLSPLTKQTWVFQTRFLKFQYFSIRYIGGMGIACAFYLWFFIVRNIIISSLVISHDHENDTNCSIIDSNKIDWIEKVASRPMPVMVKKSAKNSYDCCLIIFIGFLLVLVWEHRARTFTL